LATQKIPTPSPPEGNDEAGLQQTPLNKESEDARVHCAVLNHPPAATPPRPANPAPHRRRAVRDRDDPGRDNNPHPRATPDQGRARSLRTQQRAYDHPPHRPPSTPGHPKTPEPY